MSMNPRRSCLGSRWSWRPWACLLALSLPLVWSVPATACETTPRRVSPIKKIKKKHRSTTTTTTKPPAVKPTNPTTPLPEKVTDQPTTPPKLPTTVVPTTPTTTNPTTTNPPTPPVAVPELVRPIPEPSTALIGLGMVGALAVAMRTRRQSR